MSKWLFTAILLSGAVVGSAIGAKIVESWKENFVAELEQDLETSNAELVEVNDALDTCRSRLVVLERVVEREGCQETCRQCFTLLADTRVYVDDLRKIMEEP